MYVTTINNKKETIDSKTKSKRVMFDSLTGERERGKLYDYFIISKNKNQLILKV